MTGSTFRRWVLPLGLIALGGIAGAWAIVARHSGSLLPEAPPPAAPPAPPPPPPPEPEAPLVVVAGGELGGRFWVPPCSKLQEGGVERLGGRLITELPPGVLGLLLDLGDGTRSEGAAAAAEVGASLRTLGEMGMVAAAVGESDLAAGLDAWREARKAAGPHFTVLCANLRDGRGEPLVQGLARFQLKRRKVLVVATLSPSFEPLLRAQGVDVRILPPAPAIREALAAEGKADLVVLLSHAPPEETMALVKELPGVHLAITAHAGEHPWLEPVKVDGRPVLAPGPGWKYISVATFEPGAQGYSPRSFRTEGIGKSLPPRPFALLPSTEARDRMKQPGVLEGVFDAAAGRFPPTVPRFVGPAACASCHASAHASWSGETDPHRRAADRLRKNDFWAVPDCLRCHVTAVGLPGGYRKPGDEQSGVTCEACHGPGGGHVASSGGERMLDAKASCSLCHTPEMSPLFRYDEAWPRVRHGR